jgi:hypothetical protein
MMLVPPEPRANGWRRSLEARRLPLGHAQPGVIFDGVSILTSPGVVMTPVPTTRRLSIGLSNGLDLGQLGSPTSAPVRVP